MTELSSINFQIVHIRPTALLKVILYGDKKLTDKSNHQMLTPTITCIKNMQWFEQVLF